MDDNFPNLQCAPKSEPSLLGALLLTHIPI